MNSLIRIAGGCFSFSIAWSAMAQNTPTNARANELRARYMTLVQTELTSKLDTKSAAAGQPVIVRTVQMTKLADGTALPEGTRLVGRVVEVQSKSNDLAGSRLVMVFDHLELRDGRTIPVWSLIRNVSLPTPAFGGGNGDIVPGMKVGSGPMMNEAVGTRAADANGGVSSRGGRTPRPMADAAPADTPANPAAMKTAENGETVGTAVRATGLPGVLLSIDLAKADSGTLLESGKNLHLDGGTLITLGVIAR